MRETIICRYIRVVLNAPFNEPTYVVHRNNSINEMIAASIEHQVQKVAKCTI